MATGGNTALDPSRQSDQLRREGSLAYRDGTSSPLTHTPSDSTAAQTSSPKPSHQWSASHATNTSETDRAQSQEVLKAALSHGYLSGDAYQDQLSRIRSAATLADLRSVLPALPVSAQTPVYPSRAMRRVAWDWRIAGIVVGTFMAMFLLALLSA